MCGPTLVVRRNQKAGELIHCGNCAGQFQLTAAGEPRPTGATANAAQLEPDPDPPLMRSLVRAASRHLPLSPATG